MCLERPPRLACSPLNPTYGLLTGALHPKICKRGKLKKHPSKTLRIPTSDWFANLTSILVLCYTL